MAGRAKTSATRTTSVAGSKAAGARSSIDLLNLRQHVGLGGSSSRMSRASSQQSPEPLLRQLSTPWKKSGIWAGGSRLTLNNSACPNTGSECSLSQVIKAPVPLRSFLTAAACEGILRREDRAGRKVHPLLRRALEDTIRLWCSVGEASGTPRQATFAPRFVPKLEDIKAATLTGQFFAARYLTWDECEQVMGFPAGWTVVEADSSETRSSLPRRSGSQRKSSNTTASRSKSPKVRERSSK